MNLKCLLPLTVLVLVLSGLALPAESLSPQSEVSPYVEYALPPGITQPLGIAVDSEGTVWFAASSTDELVALDPTAGSFSTHQIPNNQSRCEVWAIAVDDAGDVWFGDTASNAIWRFNVRDASFKSYEIPTGNAYPFQLAFDGEGRILFTELYGGNIGRFDPKTGVITEFRTPSLSSGPSGFDFDENGTVWFAEQYAHSLGHFDPRTGEFTEYPLPSYFVSLRGVAVDRTGGIWVSDSTSSSIILFHPATNTTTTFTTPYSDFGYTSPYLIKRGAGSAIWFNERTGNRIGKLDTGSMQMYELQFPYLDDVADTSVPVCCRLISGSPLIPREILSISVDSLGNLWYSEFLGNVVGMVRSDYSPQYSVSVSPPGPIKSGSNGTINATVLSGSLAADVWVGQTTPEALDNLTITHSWDNPTTLTPNEQVARPFQFTVHATDALGSHGVVIYAQTLSNGSVIVSSLVTLQVVATEVAGVSPSIYLVPLSAATAVTIAVTLLITHRRRKQDSVGERTDVRLARPIPPIPTTRRGERND